MSHAAADDPTQVEWDPSATPDWTAFRQNGWKVKARATDGRVIRYRIEGKCPRCTQHTWAETGPIVPAIRDSISIWCRCSMPHANRPPTDTQNGCGAHGEITGPSGKEVSP